MTRTLCALLLTSLTAWFVWAGDAPQPASRCDSGRLDKLFDALESPLSLDATPWIKGNDGRSFDDVRPECQAPVWDYTAKYAGFEAFNKLSKEQQKAMLLKLGTDMGKMDAALKQVSAAAQEASDAFAKFKSGKAADALKLLPQLIEAEGEALDPAGKTLPAKPVTGGSLFKALSDAGWSLVDIELVSKHADPLGVKAKGAHAFFAQPGALLDAVKQVDAALGAKLEERLTAARKTLNEVNKEVADKSKTVEALKIALAKRAQEEAKDPNAGKPDNTASTPSMEQFRKTVDGKIDEALLSKLFDQVKDRPEMAKYKTPQEWGRTQEAKDLLAAARGGGDSTAYVSGADGKPYVRYIQGGGYLGQRIAVPRGTEQASPQTMEEMAVSVAAELLKKKGIQAKLEAVRQAARQAASQPSLTVGDAVREGGPGTLAGYPLGANTQQEIRDKTAAARAEAAQGHLGFLTEQARKRQAEIARLEEEHAAAAHGVDISIAPIDERNRLKADLRDALDAKRATLDESYRRDSNNTQQSLVSLQIRKAEEERRIDEHYRTEVSKALLGPERNGKAGLLKDYRALGTARRKVNPRLVQWSVNTYFSEQWDNADQADKNILEFAEKARTARSKEVEGLLVEHFRAWAERKDADIRRQEAPPVQTKKT
ncbi:MAG: hypothetical protein WC728_16260 [Elusimicrobiota bacterium]